MIRPRIGWAAPGQGTADQAGMGWRWRALALLAAGLLPCAPLRAGDFGGAVALTSQLIDRGIPIAPVKPTAQVAGYWLPSPGWSISASGSVQAAGLDDPVAYTGQLSRYWMLGDRWQMQASLLYYGYPSNDITRTFNRREVSLGWSYRDTVNLSLSSFNFPNGGRGRWSNAADLTVQLPLSERFSASVGLGVSQFPVMAYGADRSGCYEYGHLGLKWSRAGWNVELDRVLKSANTPQVDGSEGAAPWLFMVSRAF